MKIMFFCPQCKQAYSAEHDEKVLECRDCKKDLIPLNISKEDWDKLSREEKEQRKNTGLDALKQAVVNKKQTLDMSSFEKKVLECLGTIKHDIHFIYVVLLVEIIGAVVWAIYSAYKLSSLF